MTGYTGTLTPEVLAECDSQVAEWMAVGLSTERCDRPRAEAAVSAAYEAAGLAPPEVVIWMDSPLGGDQLRDQLGDQLRDQLGGQLWDQLRDQLWDQLWGQLRDQLRDQLRGQLRDQLGGQLRDQLRDQLWDQLRDQLRDQLGGQLWDQLRDQQLGGQLGPWRDSYWLALYSVALTAAGLPADPRLDAFAAACREVWGWWPCEGGVVLSDRPTVIARDAQGRLHSTTGPALAYADGYVLHAVHGVRVDADVVEDPSSITVDRILTHDNAEQRRVMIDMRGWDWFVAAAGLDLVDEADDPANAGERLGLYDLPEQVYDEPVRVLLCRNASPERDGTRRRFGLTVPADCSSAVAAAAWTFGVDAATYQMLERAT